MKIHSCRPVAAGLSMFGAQTILTQKQDLLGL